MTRLVRFEYTRAPHEQPTEPAQGETASIIIPMTDLARITWHLNDNMLGFPRTKKVMLKSTKKVKPKSTTATSSTDGDKGYVAAE